MKTEHIEPDAIAGVDAHGVDAHGVPQRTWFARHKLATALLAGAGLVAVAAAVGGPESNSAAVGGPEAAGQSGAMQDVAPTEQQTAAVPAAPAEPEPVVGFEPISYSGSGDTIQPVEIPETGASHVMITVSHAGSRNVAVWSLDGDLNRTDLLVNEIGSYDGTTIVESDTSALSIEADGAWTVTLQPISNAPTFADTYTAAGSGVVIYTGSKGVADISHTGDSNFAVWAYPERGSSDLLVNEIGTYSGQSIMPAGPAVLVVSGDGPWTITVS